MKLETQDFQGARLVSKHSYSGFTNRAYGRPFTKINFRYNSNKSEFKKKFECQIFIENSNPKNLREILVLGLKKLINSQAIKNGCQ